MLEILHNVMYDLSTGIKALERLERFGSNIPSVTAFLDSTDK